MNLLSLIFYSDSVPFIILRLCLLLCSLEIARILFSYLRIRKTQRDINRIISDDK